VESGTQERGIVLQVAGRRTSEAFSNFLESSILTPSFPRGENLLMLQYSVLEVPT
jgi:hypothetical protein